MGRAPSRRYQCREEASTSPTTTIDDRSASSYDRTATLDRIAQKFSLSRGSAALKPQVLAPPELVAPFDAMLLALIEDCIGLMLPRTYPRLSRTDSLHSNGVLKFVIGFASRISKTENNARVPSARRPLLSSCFSSDADMAGEFLATHSVAPTPTIGPIGVP